MHPQKPQGPQDEDSEVSDAHVLITAEEAYPAMERAFLAARHEVWAGFRVFDLSTKLRSDEGLAIGNTWFDIIVHVLRKGVALHFILSDFDPIIGADLHAASWQARRQFIAAQEVVGLDAKLHVTNALHSARIGMLPRILLWPALVRKLAKEAKKLNSMPPAERAHRLECSPGLRPFLIEETGGRLKSRKWPPPPLVPGTHHQKIAVFDRELLCVGGLDLDERRYDDKGHHRRRDKTWHDVQLMCRGPVAQSAQRHLEGFLDVVAGKSEPSGQSGLLRTLSSRRRLQFPFLGPRPEVCELARAHLRAIKGARQLIYLESQFFRDFNIADTLAEAAARNPNLDLILILPAAPEVVAFEGATGADARHGEYLQAQSVARVIEAFGDRAAICSPVRPKRSEGRGRDVLHGSPIIYVHAKVSVFDDARAIVSSANLNGRSMLWDTEAGVEMDRASDVHGLRKRVFTHWQDKDTEQEFFDLDTAAGCWRARAQENAVCEPEARRGFLVPHDVRPARAFGRWYPGLPHALV
jgi:phospholipase D1/2